MARVLVVDDEESIRLVLRTLLSSNGYEVQVVASGEQAMTQLGDFDPDYVLSDVKMPGMDGLTLCERVIAERPGTTVIMMSAYGNLELALSAMRAGAYDYVAKPFKQDEVLFALRKAEERQSLRRENAALRAAADQDGGERELLGDSRPIQAVWRVVRKVAEYRTTVLIQGESGTGKELVARALHRLSPRAERPFVPINCGAIPASLMESELFGHRRGAFTDAHADKRGIFQEADGGTLFLDEVGEIEPALQVKLLRVLQEGSVRPVGATKDVSVDVRVVAATVRDLEADVQEGRFREDLYYRLNVLQVNVPSLRERVDDVPMLIDHFVARNNERLGTQITGVSPRALKSLLGYRWPGNVRELENLIERAVVMTDADQIGLEDLPERVQRGPDVVAEVLAGGDLSIKRAVRTIEQSLIQRALEQTSGNRTAAAKLLEISHRALLYKIKDYHL